MSKSVYQDWIYWCDGDTTRATENDWNRFVQETYDAWAKDKSGYDEILNELEGNEWDAYYEEHYSQDIFFENSNENEELSFILNGHFNLASVCWEADTIISFSTPSFPFDEVLPEECEKVSLQHLRNFYLMECLKTDKPNELGTWGRDDQSDPDNEIRKLLAFYLKYREEVEDIHEE
ncbi:hypothetical protein G6700_09325 [Polynucleobacter paneuropaeus]|jgi:hypothetical protein|nr:hypothetical protein G6700_09325 [Polynucleobacter paneuropaeus]